MTNEQKLVELKVLSAILDEPQHADHPYRLGFLAGRGFELTRGMDEHPEWWTQGCCCDSCNSYGE